ncbi:hypothetical protein DRW03_36060 [Corallococcus sp. H22C18031201]|nr:hypothetical protein DRW03_36060 [Corallococcus sp. H22C18031201]
MTRRTQFLESDDVTQHWWECGGDICFYDSVGEVSRLSQREIQEQAVEMIRQQPNGIRFMDLARAIHNRHPQTPFTSIPGALNPIGRAVFADLVSKPERGLFAPAGMEEVEGAEPTVREEEYYLPLAEFLEGDAEDVTAVVPMGGRGLGGKWGTPDVLGVYRPTATDVLSWSPEILAVEVKTTTKDVVVAFGQAVAYQLFATKTYLALPRTISLRDRRELVARCKLHGLGLILFGTSPRDEYSVVVHARRCPPDIEATRRFIERLRAHDEEKFRTLFG